MAIKTYKPVTNGRRNMTSLTYEEITNTVLSISKEIKIISQVKLQLLNMIQIDQQTSH